MQDLLNKLVWLETPAKNGKRLIYNCEPNCEITKETKKAVFLEKKQEPNVLRTTVVSKWYPKRFLKKNQAGILILKVPVWA